MIDLDVDALKAELNGIYEERNHVSTVSCCLCLVAALAWSWENGGKSHGRMSSTHIPCAACQSDLKQR